MDIDRCPAIGAGHVLVLGLLGVVPLLAHASWHAYRDLVVPPVEVRPS